MGFNSGFKGLSIINLFKCFLVPLLRPVSLYKESRLRSSGMSQFIDSKRLPKFRTFALLSSLPGPLYSEDEDITILRKSVNIY